MAAVIASAFVAGVGAGSAATAVSEPAASSLPTSDAADRSTRVTCVTSAWDVPLSLEAAAVRINAERPPAAWPAPAAHWWQPTGTRAPVSLASMSLDPSNTSVVHWLGQKERLLAAHASQLEFLVTRAYEHVLLDRDGRVVSSRRGDLESVVTIDISPSSALESRHHHA